MLQKISPGSTKERLILTALEQFAVHGIDAVSLRTISALSGTKNSAAAHYHFTDKAGLIAAMIDWIGVHLDRISADDLVFLDAATRTPAPLRAIVEAGYRRMFRLRAAYPWGAAAVKFLSRLLIETDPDIRAAINRNFLPNILRTRDALATALPGADPMRLTLRILIAAEASTHAAADIDTLSSVSIPGVADVGPEFAMTEYFNFLAAGLVRDLD